MEATVHIAANIAGARLGGARVRVAHQKGVLPCFVAGTPIRKLDGSVAIEQLRAGDVVLSRDEYDAAGEVTGRRVEEVCVRRALVMAVGVAGREIETTEEHPFWVVGRGWTAANEIAVGDRVLSASGEELSIESVGGPLREAVVYNFRVEELHTYFVGDPIGWGFDVWVHNTHKGTSAAKRAKEDAERDMRQEDAAELSARDSEFYGGDGVIYRVPGSATTSGKPYVGSADDLAARTKSGKDGRDRSKAEVVGRYPIGDKDARRNAEQRAIDDNGGLNKLDNKRNEIAE